MGGAGHLTKRFIGSLVPMEPPRRDAAWAEEQLLPGEVDLWRQMSRADRRHAVGVARRVRRTLGDRADRPVLAAALLHDVGKLASGLGTYGRVVATVFVKVAGRARARSWIDRRGFAHRLGTYSEHPRLGGDMGERAGSDPFTVAWTREHHLPSHEWSVPPPIGQVLRAADDD